MKSFRKCSSTLGFAVILVMFLSGTAAASPESTADTLAKFFRAARSVVAVRRDMIGEPKKTPVGTTFVKGAKGIYKRHTGAPLDETSPYVRDLMEAIAAVADKAHSGGFDEMWPSGQYAKKLLPARFAKAVADEFSSRTGNKASIKLTVPDELLVNPENRADDWEREVINGQFKGGSWPRNKIFTAQIDSTFRYILPEYYDGSCLGCHGGDNGKDIHAGKVEGKMGDIGGAISVTLTN